ncbi:hypothetical protein I552_5612 [Mycobacterium xenopi 3993]|nr:hypothetical protein I552_5612 [Mycobacterium xenopi 3993]
MPATRAGESRRASAISLATRGHARPPAPRHRPHWSDATHRAPPPLVPDPQPRPISAAPARRCARPALIRQR